jgi:hypothetical protein
MAVEAFFMCGTSGSGKEKLGFQRRLYEILQMLRLARCEKTPIFLPLEATASPSRVTNGRRRHPHAPGG